MINYLLICLLFVISIIFADQFLIKWKAERYKKKHTQNSKTKENFFKHFISKINFIKTKENFLSKQGYPLKLNVISYYTLKIILMLLFFIAGTINYNSYFVAIILGTLGYFIIDVFIYINKKSRDSEICTDLMHVTDSISLQLSAHVSLKNSLKKQYENCKNKDLKKALLELSMKYELSELNIIEATKTLEDKFDVLEISMFCKALATYNETTEIENVLANLSTMLKEKNIEKLKQNTVTKIIYITFGVVVALGNIILITFYPLFTSIGQGFNDIFK